MWIQKNHSFETIVNDVWICAGNIDNFDFRQIEFTRRTILFCKMFGEFSVDSYNQHKLWNNCLVGIWLVYWVVSMNKNINQIGREKKSANSWEKRSVASISFKDISKCTLKTPYFSKWFDAINFIWWNGFDRRPVPAYKSENRMAFVCIYFLCVIFYRCARTYKTRGEKIIDNQRYTLMLAILSGR